MPSEGIEPSPTLCKSIGLPLTLTGHFRGAEGTILKPFGSIGLANRDSALLHNNPLIELLKEQCFSTTNTMILGNELIVNQKLKGSRTFDPRAFEGGAMCFIKEALGVVPTIIKGGCSLNRAGAT